jgi:hypothetical protein
MSVIYKYRLDPYKPIQTLDLHYGWGILTVQVQHGGPVLWATIDPNMPKRQVEIYIVGTGKEMPNPTLKEPRAYLHYINTFQLEEGYVIGHVFVKMTN